MLLLLLSLFITAEEVLQSSSETKPDLGVSDENVTAINEINTSIIESITSSSEANDMEANIPEDSESIINTNSTEISTEIAEKIQNNHNETSSQEEIISSSLEVQSSTENTISTETIISTESESTTHTPEQTTPVHEDPHHWPGQRKCVGAHTQPDFDGGCRCEDGYSGGADPNVTGCWKCSNCHRLAACVSEGVCKCRAGLLGDGVTSCDPPAPVIVRVERPSPGQLAPVPVRVVFDASGFTPSVAYCRFGSKRVASLIHGDGTLSCLQPDKIRGSTQLSITFDGNVWSSPVTYEVVPGVVDPPRTVRQLAPPPPPSGKRRPLLLAALAVAALALVAAAVYVSLRPQPVVDEERMPLLEDSRKRI